MKRTLIAVIAVFAFVVNLDAQTTNEFKYRRSSLYSIMISHSNEKFSKEIEEEFLAIPIPDKFDNHDLSVKVVTSSDRVSNQSEVTEFLEKNKVASRLVGKWFERNPKTGECNVDLVAQRGLFGASYEDVEKAKMTEKGIRALEDAGEELIGNTFVIVNDIHYYDKNKGAQIGAATLKVAGVIASFWFGSAVSDLADMLGDIIASINGFSVTITTYLYRLEWNNDIAGEFYSTQYLGYGEKDDVKRKAFDSCQNYRLNFVGTSTIKADDVTMAGVDDYDLARMIRKVCTRALDKSIVVLQKKYDEFKTKTVVEEVKGDVITAHIGLREGVSEDCTYEVLLPKINDKGKTVYARVGLVQPIRNMICDNRYMAANEDTPESHLVTTSFKKISGGDFMRGMLLREVKTK